MSNTSLATTLQSILPDMPEDVVNTTVDVIETNFKVDTNDDQYQTIQHNYYENLKIQFWEKYQKVKESRVDTVVLFADELRKVEEEYETAQEKNQLFILLIDTDDYKGKEPYERFVEQSRYVDYKGIISTLFRFKTYLEEAKKQYVDNFYSLTLAEIGDWCEYEFQERLKEQNLVPKIDSVHSNGENLDFADVLIDFTETEILADHDYNTIHRLAEFMQSKYGLPGFRCEAVIENLEENSKYYKEKLADKGIPNVLSREQVSKAIRKDIQTVDGYRKREIDPLPFHRNGRKVELYY